MNYAGDVKLGNTIDLYFTTRAFATGVPTTLAGTPSVAAYVGNSITEITAGITLDVDFDGRGGLNHVRVVASSGNGFAAATDIWIVVTAGTVGGTSVVGETVAAFSIENRCVNWASVVGPTTAVVLTNTTVGTLTTYTGNTVQTGDSFARIGAAGAGLTNIDLPNQTMDIVGNITGNLSGSVGSVTGAVGSVTARVTANSDQWAGTTIPAPKTNGVPIVDWIPTGWRQNTAAGGAAGSITLDAAASAVNDFYKYSLIMILSGTGAGQARVCIGYVQATKVATVVPNWTTNPDNTSVFATMPLAIASVEGWLGAVAPANTGDAFARIGAAGAGLTNIDLPNQTMDIVGNITGNLSGSVGSVTGAVGSVTGNVGGNVTGSVGSVVAAVAITAAAVQAIWDALTAALTTVGSIGKLLVTNIDALISSRTKPADTQARVTLVDTLTTYTGNTPQTGDAYPLVSALKIKKNTALGKFPFLMVLSADHITPATGLTVVVQRSINGAAFANSTNTPATEIGASGVYYIDLSAADLNGDTIVLKMTSATADQRTIVIATEP